MNTSNLHAREKNYPAVVAFPATKTSGALTVWSSDMYPFEGGAYGPALISLVAADKSKIGTSGDTIDVNVFVSFGSGDSWLKVATYKDLRYAASGTVNVQYWIPLAPRLKLNIDFAAGDSLVAGHGCAINVQFKELYPGMARSVYYDNYKTASYGFVGATKAAGDSTWGWYSARAGIKSSTAITSTNGFFDGIMVWAHADDRSKITNAFKVAVQYSDDGTTWWHGDSLGTACNPTNGTGIFMGAKESVGATPAVTYFSMDNSEWTRQASYARLTVFGDTASALASAHGVKFFMIGFKG